METPKLGDMFRCSQCGLEIHVTKECGCDNCTADFRCCGQEVEKVTEPTVQEAGR